MVIKSSLPHTTVGRYLGVRLRQLGVQHVFGLPGDFNLSLIDEMLTVDGLRWVGTTNELNAAYAADGYARLRRGVAALVTTFGVGELSAINGVAGSYAERVPVVHIVGMPASSSQQDGRVLHHTLADGDFGHFVRAAAEVTADAVVLRAGDAAQVADRTILKALNSSRPVYIGVPADVAVSMVPERTLERSLRPTASDGEQIASLKTSLRDAIGATHDVTVLAGPLIHRRRLETAVSSIAAHPGVRVATQSASKALLDESHPAHLGVYAGEHTVAETTRRGVDDAGVLVLAGAILSDFLTGFFSHGFDPDAAIDLGLDQARVNGEVFYDVHLDDSLALLDELLAERGVRPLETTDPGVIAASGSPRGREPITHAVLWPTLEAWLRPGTTVVAEAGTAFYGAVDLRLPDDCELLGQPVWSSIGYTLPATLGAMLAAPGREAVLIIGDGSAQLTAPEIGTILRLGMAPTILVLDNDGYTVERLIQSPDASYQGITRWNWTALPHAFGSADTVALKVETLDELDSALVQARASASGALIQIVLPRDDAPELLTRIAHGVR